MKKDNIYIYFFLCLKYFLGLYKLVRVAAGQFEGQSMSEFYLPSLRSK